MISVLANLSSWIIPLILPPVLAEPTGTAISIEGRIGMYLMLIPFICGTLIIYSLIRLFFPTKRSRSKKAEMFYSYSEKLLDDRNRTALLLSFAGGSINCIVLYFTVIWGRMAIYG